MPDRYDEGNLKSSFILDYGNSGVQFVVTRLNTEFPAWIDYLRAAHKYVCENVKPSFSLERFMSASVVLENKKGSTNQRTSVLEAFARAKGIPTRCRALWVKRELWQNQLGPVSMLVPEKVLIAWPQFWIDSQWKDLDELVGSPNHWQTTGSPPFDPSKTTLFEAVGNTFVDLLCKSGESPYNLGKWVISEAGFYDTRDELFAKLAPPVRNPLAEKMCDWIGGGKICL